MPKPLTEELGKVGARRDARGRLGEPGEADLLLLKASLPAHSYELDEAFAIFEPREAKVPPEGIPAEIVDLIVSELVRSIGRTPAEQRENRMLARGGHSLFDPDALIAKLGDTITPEGRRKLKEKAYCDPEARRTPAHPCLGTAIRKLKEAAGWRTFAIMAIAHPSFHSQIPGLQEVVDPNNGKTVFNHVRSDDGSLAEVIGRMYDVSAAELRQVALEGALEDMRSQIVERRTGDIPFDPATQHEHVCDAWGLGRSDRGPVRDLAARGEMILRLGPDVEFDRSNADQFERELASVGSLIGMDEEALNGLRKDVVDDLSYAYGTGEGVGGRQALHVDGHSILKSADEAAPAMRELCRFTGSDYVERFLARAHRERQRNVDDLLERATRTYRLSPDDFKLSVREDIDELLRKDDRITQDLIVSDVLSIAQTDRFALQKPDRQRIADEAVVIFARNTFNEANKRAGYTLDPKRMADDLVAALGVGGVAADGVREAALLSHSRALVLGSGAPCRFSDIRCDRDAALRRRDGWSRAISGIARRLGVPNPSPRPGAASLSLCCRHAGMIAALPTLVARMGFHDPRRADLARQRFALHAIAMPDVALGHKARKVAPAAGLVHPDLVRGLIAFERHGYEGYEGRFETNVY